MSDRASTPTLAIFDRSPHQQRVDGFMVLAGQDLPTLPCRPPFNVRKLRAKLILEEALETIAALGVSVVHDIGLTSRKISKESAIEFVDNGAFDLREVIDGCCDLKVVTTGTLSACGIPDEMPQLMVDQSNLAKFGPGGYRREDGKWIKPPDHKSPDWNAFLRALAADYEAIEDVAAPAEVAAATAK